MKSRFLLDRRLWLIPLLLCTALVGALLLADLRAIDHHVHEMALERARVVFRLIETTRLWNARHGGLYAVVDGETPPNPYLEVPERDVVSARGTRLTLVNPAYMTRQLTALIDRYNGMRVRLTSLDPVNPVNAPDPWEAAGLEALRDAAAGSERFAFTAGETGPQARYLAPLYVKRPCLACHEKHGYALGDLRGGVSVSFPAEELVASMAPQRRTVIQNHLLVWLLLAAVTALGLERGRRQVLSLRSDRERQEALVESRTAELRRETLERQQTEARLELVIESSGDGIVGLDRRGRCTLCNQAALDLLGLPALEAIRGRPFLDVVRHCRHDGSPVPPGASKVVAAYHDGIAGHADDELFTRGDGTTVEVEYRARPIIEQGALLGAVVTFSDVGRRKRYERELRKLSQALEHAPSATVITDADGWIEFVNRQFSELTGYRPDEVIGRNPRFLQSGLTPPETYRALWTTIRAGEAWHGEFHNRRRDGALFWQRVSVSPIIDEAGVITHFVAVGEDVTDEKRAQEAVWRQANHDHLTGLPNRSLFHDRLGQALIQARRNRSRLALLFIDLDGFKAVNDSLGHNAGDELLRTVAQRLNGALRDSDTAARLAGDEFAVVLPAAASREDAATVARKILAALAEPYELGGGAAAAVSASIGIAVYPDHAEAEEALLQVADAAMYVAKQAGKNTFRFADERIEAAR